MLGVSGKGITEPRPNVFDSNGNTTFNGQQNVYDFENRLVQAGGVNLVYDGDGNRVQETVAGVTTKYLVGEINPTGYAQVFAELNGTNGLLRGYEWGLQLEAVRDFTVNPNGIFHYYGHDGHGSVRWLTDSNGAITDTYDYDAFGNLISSTGTTVNNYLFAGEQFDPALGIYYNRARYYDQRQGRFWTADTWEGDPQSPASLHKYLYTHANPINRLDPSGHYGLTDLAVSFQVIGITIAQTFPTLVTLGRVGLVLVNAYFLFTDSQYAFAYFNVLGPVEALRAIQSDYLIVSNAAGAFQKAAFVPRQFFSVLRLSIGRGLVLDIGGGLRSPVPNAINIDPRAEEGIASTADVLQKVVPGRASRVYVTNPQYDFLDSASQALQPGWTVGPEWNTI